MKMWNIPLLMLMYFFSLNAGAVLMSEVGPYDIKLGEDRLANSGSATEEAWIEGIIGFDIDYTHNGAIRHQRGTLRVIGSRSLMVRWAIMHSILG